MHIDIDAQTLNALDWNSVLEALSGRARTPMGKAAALGLALSADRDVVGAWLDEVDEVLALEGDGGTVPVGGIDDIDSPLARASKGAVLDKDELRLSGRALVALDQLGGWLLDAPQHAPLLQGLAPSLRVDPQVLDELQRAFDETGELSGRRFPELGALRTRVTELHATIRRTLEEMVKGDTLADELQDRYVTQRGDRYVVPVKANFKRKELGIVHGMSGSGNTAFVEPTQVVALNNELRLAEGRLQAEERRILMALSAMLGRVGVAGREALRVATRIDLAVARADLARRLDAVRPVVGREGVLRLTSARHPLLALRGVDVVANDVTLDARSAILVVSGPNTGGKTVALKTVGLAALLVRIGCFVPAAEGSRVDLFDDVVAVVGDHQTVHGDHSSFSSHLVALRAMIERARPGCLYLVDEIASGTDPQQGAALAHAFIERLLDRGVRGLITTHFHRLKTLATVEPRVAMAGMQFADGHPTYRLLLGASGESHALDIAVRVGVPADLVDRARALMDEGERNLAETLAALDRERSRAEEAQARATRLAAELEARSAAFAKRQAELDARARAIEQERAAGYLARLAGAEKAVAAVVADLQRAPSHDKVAAARASLDALKGLAPSRPAVEVAAEAPELAVGDAVKLLKIGDTGEVVGLGRRISVRTSRGLVLRVDPAEVLRVHTPEPAPAPAPPPRRGRGKATDAPSLDHAVRLDGNTLDLRGLRVDEGLEEVDRFLDRASLDERGVVFVLHGHGTGAMKQAVRQHLARSRYVGAWQPASPDQGGDAYTVAALRG
ncbi:MAG: Smr/MutS family protein [Alphaproteobacteria bacterium]|nr:Smr/MutS family protein [Alphaproteobacteria bacterium]